MSIRKPKYNLLVFDNTNEMSQFALGVFIEIAKEAIKNRGIFTVAFPGGKTPIDFYGKLAEKKEYVKWRKTHIFLTDERYVPLTDNDSNYRMIKENLLDKINIPKDNIHNIPFLDTKEQSAEEYEKEIITIFKNDKIPIFDLILLGVGKDGHTASLFPKDKALYETKRIALSVDVESLKHKRITITLPLINSTRNVIFMAKGENKALVLKEIMDQNTSLPAALVKPGNGNLLFILDKEVAGELKDKIVKE